MRVNIKVIGVVQGVGFRPFIYRIALKHGLTGYVRNLGDAGVEVLVEGAEEVINHFLVDLQKTTPPQAEIYNIIKMVLTGKNECSAFKIVASSQEAALSGSVIPPDIAICDECFTELRNSNDPRFDYFFITCTNCGPRFTIIDRLPYDRENTTMRDFPLCSFCLKEYQDPLNRRFHAQTVACPPCGPKAYLASKNGIPVQAADPVREAGKLLSEGKLVAVKGYGGFHIVSSVAKEEPLKRLRGSKHRRSKPFALMAKSLEEILRFAEVNSKEKELLTSPARPIVLLNKKKVCNLPELVAPGLHNVGVMLPYSAMHYMLFDRVVDGAFVMTSANPPNEPIVNDNNEALKVLGGTVDYFLFHDRTIAQRCDDSVTRVHGDTTSFIRRSRGYAPAPIRLKQPAKHNVVGLGGELNNASCILNGDKAFLSQHIGDVENLETRRFLKQATAHLIRLTNSKIDAVACDLHPKFTTTNLARELADLNGWQLIQVQHHHAHIAALMAEHGLDEIVGVACDGYGYGLGGEAWGGEILHCKQGSLTFKRLGHLESQPLLGGDASTRFPLRMAAGILSKKIALDFWLLENSGHLLHGETEARLILNQIKKPRNLPQTSSLGRVLDAAAAILGVCYERSYEGEAAMKLESAAIFGKDALRLAPIIHGDTLETTQLLVDVFKARNKISTVDLACSVHTYLAKGLAALAAQKALDCGVGVVGFSGGAAVNSLLAHYMKKSVEKQGLRFVSHEAVPAGDGGVSLGQAVVGGFADL